MALCKVKQLLYANMVDMGGIPVRQPLPTNKVEQIDPFLLLHHHTGNIKPASKPLEVGVGPHPHRGFSPVTFIYQGDVHHRDSRGNSQVVGPDGVQWMDVGMGIVHSERPSKEIAKGGGVQEIIQLWINTPKAYKMDPPHCQAYTKDELPQLQLESGKGFLSLVCGDQNGQKGPVNAKLEILAITGKLEKDASHTFSIPDNANAILYLLDGSIKIEGYGLVDELNLIHFHNGGDEIRIQAEADTRILLLTGEPLSELLATYGPFVMNTQTEIMEAMRDYQTGKMGVLVEEDLP